METIKAVFDYTFREHVRHKVWLSGALFGLALVAGGLVASALAQDERARMMLDLGLAANELIALVSVVFLTVHLILQEIESRLALRIDPAPLRPGFDRNAERGGPFFRIRRSDADGNPQYEAFRGECRTARFD